MTDSGFTQFPSRPSSVPEQSAPKRGAEEVQTRVVGDIPEDLRDVRRIVQLRGEVVRQRAENVVTIRTQRGDVDVRVPEGERPPREGQRVTVTIQPGKPPQQATIKPAPAQTIENPQTTAAERHNTQDQVQIRTRTTPVDVQVGQNQRAQSADAQTIKQPVNPEAALIQRKTLPPVGSAVQLQPLSPKQALAYIQQTQASQSIIEAVVTQIIQSTGLSANIVVQDTQNQLQNTLITAQPIQTTPGTTPSTTLATPLAGQAVSDLIIPQINQPLSESSALLFQAFIANNTAAESPQNTVSPAVVEAAAQALPFSADIALLAPGATTPTASPEATETNLSAFFRQSRAPTATLSPEILPLEGLNSPIQISSEITLSQITPLYQPITARLDFINQSQPVITEGKLNESILDVLKFNVKSVKTPTADVKDIEQLNQLITEKTSATTLQAYVTGLTDKNLPILTFFSADGSQTQHFVLQAPVSDITPGTEIQLTPLRLSTMNVNITSVAPIVNSLEPGFWPVFHDLYQTVQQTSPAITQALSNITPNSANPAQMMPAAMFFIAAVRGGDIGNWLGDKALDTLRRSERGNSILSRLTQESGLLSRLGAEPVSQDWRGMPLPFIHQEEMQKITLFYRHEHASEDQDEQNKKQTRFIFNLDLSQMGEVQLDGLYRPHISEGKNARLDLIVRTQEHFSQAMQTQMRRLYSKALQETQVAGELSFQNKAQNWVVIDVQENAPKQYMA